MNLKKIVLFFLLLSLPMNVSGCDFKKQESKEKQIKIYVGIKDKESLNIIKNISDFYQKKNPNVKLDINNIIGDSIDNNVLTNNDILCINRGDMLDLARKGLVSDIKNFYEENNMADRYYSVVKSYGRFNDKYYGIPIIPYSLEFLYNKYYFEKNKMTIPSNREGIYSILKKLNGSSQKIPVIVNEDMDINNALFSIAASNCPVTMRSLENIYDSGMEGYNKLVSVQDIFSKINTMVKGGEVNKDTFEIGNISSIEKFENGDIPLILVSSYYSKNFNSENIHSLYENISDSETPIISNMLVCIPTGSGNTDDINDFMKFVFGDTMQNHLKKLGYVTGNKKVNIGNKGIKNTICKHIEYSTDDNIAVIYNLPNKMKSHVSSKVENILAGKYNGNEWKEIIQESY